MNNEDILRRGAEHAMFALNRMIDGLSEREIILVKSLSTAFTRTVMMNDIVPERALEIFRLVLETYEEVSLAARIDYDEYKRR